MKKRNVFLLISILFIFLGSFLASLFNTSFFKVKVNDIEFKTERGTLVGSLYMPKDIKAGEKRPVIITTHGYLNSKEMQDAPAVEMSRRGFIVLALDMYDHGYSLWKNSIDRGSEFGTFWIYSVYDAAQYMSKQDYTLKDEKGNSYIAVSGHSMGGFSTTVSVYLDEMNALKSGTRSIFAAIPVGADFSYAAMIAPQDQLQAAMGDRTFGVIAGHYDEFFFGKSVSEKTDEEKKINGTVIYKDFVSTNSGKTFLGKSIYDSPKQGIFYNVDSGNLIINDNIVRDSQKGKHIIYTPNQTHPWNHFSQTTTSHLIDFYTEAFKDVSSFENIPSSNQIWWLKELFNFVALIGFFMIIIPIIDLILNISFFKGAITKESISVTKIAGNNGLFFWILVIIGTLIPAIIFSTVMSKISTGMNVLFVIGLICLVGSVATSFVFLKGKTRIISASILGIVSALFILLIKVFPNSFGTTHFLPQPTNNQIIYWAMISGLISLFTIMSVYFFKNKKFGVTKDSFGVLVSIKSIFISLIIAVLAVFIAYIILYIIQAIFGVDFRLWTFAIKTFTIRHFVTALKYGLFFFVYYFINTIVINFMTRDKKGGYAIAIFSNIGGLLIWVILQYGLLFTRGVALYPAQALNGILLFALIPCLAIAAVYAKSIYKRTNNVWLAGFVNTFLFTMIGVANTILFWNIN
ncbi:hypothetical protein OF820_07625 [Oceanotoga sp. DSM 15011]|uniref:hypothetical protein n=1 Tax=Oceanotoga sp. DSM 15011 TaxID=2984951 RepID=UPI0021F4FA81|nr:hypothetical protein [Oceanotoga sp. DSM 15011]UYO98942.1 hypothetical protein OF820_07625 [Oceanotoga sp. DSM 15011]